MSESEGLLLRSPFATSFDFEPLSPRCREKIAIDCLKKNSWGVEPGIDFFFASGLGAVSNNTAANMQQIEAMFMKYKGGGACNMTPLVARRFDINSPVQRRLGCDMT